MWIELQNERNTKFKLEILCASFKFLARAMPSFFPSQGAPSLLYHIFQSIPSPASLICSFNVVLYLIPLHLLVSLVLRQGLRMLRKKLLSSMWISRLQMRPLLLDQLPKKWTFFLHQLHWLIIPYYLSWNQKLNYLLEIFRLNILP